MLPKALLAAALATSTASAFLLPPPTDVQAEHERHRHHNNKDIDAAGGEVVDAAVSLVSPFYHEFTKVKVPCPGCSMQIRKHGHKHHKGKHGDEDDEEKKEVDEDAGKIITLTDVANHINLFFKIDHAADRDRLLVNDFELYPDVNIYNGGLMAVQVPDRFRHHGKGNGKHHHDEEKEEKTDEKEHDKKEGDGEESELKKRHRRHRKHHDDGNDNKDVEVKHRKQHKEHAGFKDGKLPALDFHRKHHNPFVPVPLGYSMQMRAVGQDASNGMEVVSLSLQIIEVNGVFIQGIPAVNVRLIRTAEGGLMIARIDVGDQEDGADASPPSHHGSHNGAKGRMAALKEKLDQCPNILCRWKVIMSATFKSHHHGGCPGKTMGKAMSKDAAKTGDDHDDNNDDGKDHDRHHHHHHHHGHHGHYKLREHSWAQLFKKFASHILLPVLIGVAAGIFVSLVGMVVGTVIVGLWRLVFRRGRQAAVRTHHHHRHHRHSRSRNLSASKVAAAAARHADEAAVDEEKAGLMATATEELPYHDEDPKTDSV